MLLSIGRRLAGGSPAACSEAAASLACRRQCAPQKRRCVASRAGGEGIEPPDVRKLAKMAQIEVTDEEVADWEPKICEIVKWFDQLQSIDVEGVPPCEHFSQADLSAAGKDEPRQYADRDGLLQGVPDREGPFVKVPKIL